MENSFAQNIYNNISLFSFLTGLQRDRL
jgi:hypothetical protein